LIPELIEVCFQIAEDQPRSFPDFFDPSQERLDAYVYIYIYSPVLRDHHAPFSEGCVKTSENGSKID
jgi:hypothetical protein